MVHFNSLLLILSRLLHSRKEMRKYPVVTPKVGAGIQQPGVADGWAEFSHCIQNHSTGEQLAAVGAQCRDSVDHTGVTVTGLERFKGTRSHDCHCHLHPVQVWSRPHMCQTTIADLGSPAACPNTQLPHRGWHVSVRGHTEDWTVSAAIRLLTRATHITQGSGRAFKGRVVLQLPQCWLLVVVSPARTLRERLCSSVDEQQWCHVPNAPSTFVTGSKEGQLWPCRRL